jgi:cytochrome c oxidase assembly factor CtaG
MLAISGTTWLDVILTMSIVVPLAVLALVVWLFFRAAARHDAEN